VCIYKLKSQNQFFLGQPFCCFNIPFFHLFKSLNIYFNSFKGIGLFINKYFIKVCNIPLVIKGYPILIEKIDGRLIAFRHVIYWTISLEIELEGHNNFFVFNVIKIPMSPIILRLSRLRKFNPNIDWCALKIKSFAFKVQSTQPIKSKHQHPKPLFIGAKIVTRVTKYNILFAIYATSAHNNTTIMLTILNLYKKFEDIFEK